MNQEIFAFNERVKKALKAMNKNIVYKIASSRDELEQAYHLVHEEYVKRGYYEASPHRIKTSIYNMLPSTTTFIAKAKKDVIGTVTVIVDSPLGIPMESIYQSEIDQLRSEKRKIAEVSMLAVKNDLFGKSVFLMLNSRKLLFVFRLFKMVFDYVRFNEQLTDLCITHHPKHKLLYKFLAFKEIGKEKTYPGANGKPAIGQRLDLTNVIEEVQKKKKIGLERMFIKGKTHKKQLDRTYFFTPEDLTYFFLQKSSVLHNLSSEELDYIKNCYPTFDFGQILKTPKITNSPKITR